jgi:Flp pilus assembly protein TadG
MAAVRKKLCKRRKWAAAAVEMAIVTPILLTMLFGIIEYGWVFTVRQALVTAAREGARTAALPGSTVTEVETRISEYLNPLGLSTYSSDVTVDDDGRPVGTVALQIPYADVSLVGCYFGNTDGNLIASCSMRKEGVD